MEIKSSHGKFFFSQEPEVRYFFTFLKKKKSKPKRLRECLIKNTVSSSCFPATFFSLLTISYWKTVILTLQQIL